MTKKNNVAFITQYVLHNFDSIKAKNFIANVVKNDEKCIIISLTFNHEFLSSLYSVSSSRNSRGLAVDIVTWCKNRYYRNLSIRGATKNDYPCTFVSLGRKNDPNIYIGFSEDDASINTFILYAITANPFSIMGSCVMVSNFEWLETSPAFYDDLYIIAAF